MFEIFANGLKLYLDFFHILVASETFKEIFRSPDFFQSEGISFNTNILISTKMIHVYPNCFNINQENICCRLEISNYVVLLTIDINEKSIFD